MPNQPTAAATSFNSWVQCYRPNPGAGMRLFCFPYAGGSARIYRSWARHLPPFVEVCPVQLPGRDGRIAEPPLSELARLVPECGKALRPYFDRPFAFFGHSMGALLAFELAHHLQAEYGLRPEHLFASGRSAPHRGRKERHIYDLPTDELIEELRELKGTPPEVLEHPELLNLMLPLLRADFALSDTYTYTERSPLSCALTGLGGLRDAEVSREHLEAWRELTSGSFTLRMFPGDHFFIHSDEALLLDALARLLQQHAGRI